MKSIAVLLLIGAINIEDVAAISKHHHHHSEYAQLANLMAQHHEKKEKEVSEKSAKISNKEYNEFQEYFEEHPISAADTKMAWNEGMVHHTGSEYAEDAPAGYTFAQ
jgi:hypothetical protein